MAKAKDVLALWRERRAAVKLVLDGSEHALLGAMLTGRHPLAKAQYEAKDALAGRELVALRRALEKAEVSAAAKHQKAKEADPDAPVPDVEVGINVRGVDRIKDVHEFYKTACAQMPYLEAWMTLGAKLDGKELDLPDVEDKE